MLLSALQIVEASHVDDAELAMNSRADLGGASAVFVAEGERLSQLDLSLLKVRRQVVGVDRIARQAPSPFVVGFGPRGIRDEEARTEELREKPPPGVDAVSAS